MRIAFLLLLFMACLFLQGYATGAPAIPKQAGEQKRMAQVDSSAVDLRTFHKESIKRYQGDPSFNYEEHIVPVGWWQEFKHWFYQLLQRVFNNKGSAFAFKWLLIAAGVAALLFLIYKLSGMDLRAIFGRKSSAKTAIDDGDDEDNIHDIDFEEELKAALTAGNFRLAVRLRYLQSLKLLTDRQLIDWQPGKTNHVYLQELQKTTLKANFAQLTGQFEYVWYGGFPIGEQDFGAIQKDFSAFYQQIGYTNLPL